MGFLFRFKVVVMVSLALFLQADLSSAQKNSVTAIKNRSEENRTTVTITASSPFEYLVYRLANPDRLAVEISGVQNSLADNEMVVGDDFVGDINVYYFKKVGTLRLEIGLQVQVVYDASMQGSTLFILLEHGDDKNAMLAQELSESKNTIEKLSEDLALLQEQLHESGTKKRLPQKAIERAKQPENVGDMVADELRDTVDVWLESWKNKDMVLYSEYYAVSFVGRGMNKTMWLAFKRKKFEKSGLVNVVIENFEVTVERFGAVVRFTQHYSADNYSDTGLKTLLMVKEGKNWLIESEKWKPSP